MAYNSTTGSQMSGDIRYENDPEDTQIDFEDDSIALKTGGAQRFVVNNAHITASVPISCSAGIAASTFVGDGSGLTGIATGTPGGSTTQVQYNNGGSFAGSNNFTFDGKDVKIGGVTGSLIVTGSIIASSIGAGIFTTDISGSGNASFSGFELYSAGARLAYMSGSGQISASYGITASAFYGSGASLTGLPSAAITTYNSATNNYILSAVNATTVQGEANLQFDGSTLAVVGNVSSSLAVTASAFRVGLATPTTVIDHDHVSSSLNISGAAFYGSGASLTGLPSAAIATYNTSGDNRIITSVDATTVQGEADLTFNGSTLGLTGLLDAQHTAVPVAKFTHPTDNASGAVIDLLNSRGGSAGQAADFCGGVTFKAQDSTSAETQYSKISTKISSPTNSSEAGKMIFEVTTGGTSGTTYLTLDGGTSIITASAAISCSVGITASAFVGDGSGLTGIAGGGTPGGSDGQVQYNNGGAFGGEAELFYDDTNNRLGVGTSAPNHTLSVTGSAAISGDLTVSGSLRSAKRLEVTSHYFTHGATNAIYLPMGAGNTDKTTTAQEKNQFVAPFSGRLKRAIFRSAAATTTVTASIWVGSDGTVDFNAGGSIIQHVTQSSPSAATAYSINFSGTSDHFTANQIVGVSIQCQVAPGNTNVTCIWEYDDREVF